MNARVSATVDRWLPELLALGGGGSLAAIAAHAHHTSAIAAGWLWLNAILIVAAAAYARLEVGY